MQVFLANEQAICRHNIPGRQQHHIARHHFRPVDPAARRRAGDRFPDLKLFTVADTFGGWERAHAAHFQDGGTFDQVTARR